MFSDHPQLLMTLCLAMAAVSCVSELDFSIIVPPNSELIDTLGLGFPPRQYNMGGMSGGPVAIVTDGSGILAWRLSGIIYESRSDCEVLKAVQADFIRGDGTVSR
jgi:hypothetical protein